MKLTKKQVLDYAQDIELYINLPEKFLTDKMLAKRYHLERGDVSDDDERSELFYNEDLRSHCGMWGEDWGLRHDMVIFPKYYHRLEPNYFEKLLQDATVIALED